MMASLLLPLLGDVSELLLDGIAVDIGEAEGLRGGSRQSAPLRRVPTARSVPHRVQAGSLDFLDRLLDGIQASQKSRIWLGKGDVQQLSVVVFVLHNFEVSGIGSEKNHFVVLKMARVADEKREERPKD